MRPAIAGLNRGGAAQAKAITQQATHGATAVAAELAPLVAAATPGDCAGQLDVLIWLGRPQRAERPDIIDRALERAKAANSDHVDTPVRQDANTNEFRTLLISILAATVPLPPLADLLLLDASLLRMALVPAKQDEAEGRTGCSVRQETVAHCHRRMPSFLLLDVC